jgi:hypothetical protein
MRSILPTYTENNKNYGNINIKLNRKEEKEERIYQDDGRRKRKEYRVCLIDDNELKSKH